MRFFRRRRRRSLVDRISDYRAYTVAPMYGSDGLIIGWMRVSS